MKKFKNIIFILILVIFSSMMTSCKKESTSGSTINVYNAGEYIDPQVLKDFEKETGIKVIYDTFASNEDLYIKIANGHTPYDVIVPSDYMVERLIKENRLQKLDFSKIPNIDNILPEFRFPKFDPTGEYTVPYFSGTMGIVYNKTMVKTPPTSWKDLWNPEYKRQIIMYNSQRDSIAIALKMLGYSMNSVDPFELQEAKKALIEQKPLVYAYLTDDGRDVMVQGDGAMMPMYSGDAAYMISENKDLDYVIPKEGANIWMDSMCIPKDAKNVEGAHEFINYLLRKDVGILNADYCMGYTSPIKGVKEGLPEELRNSKVAYPDYNHLPPLEYFKDLGENSKLYDRIWTEVSATFVD